MNKHETHHQQKEKIIVYPCSANPPTWGHADLMFRASLKFDKVYWVVAHNPQKNPPFTIEERKLMMDAYVQHYNLKNVVVDDVEGAVVRYANDKGAQFLLRGLRNTTDFQAELELAAGNRGIDKSIETLCMFAKPHYATISSALIRELASLGEKIDQYVLPSLQDLIYKKLCQIKRR